MKTVLHYHSLVRARTGDYEPYLGAVGNPDFNFRSVRASAVTRWELRPGSALSIVWNENRAARSAPATSGSAAICAERRTRRHTTCF